MISPLQVPRSALGRLEPLAEGGQALIYRLPGYYIRGEGPLVYKEYKAEPRRRAGPAVLPGLLALTDFRLRLSASDRAELDQRATWPLVVVTGDDGGAAGIVMREIPAEFFHGSEIREIQQLFNADADARVRGLPAFDVATRLKLLARLAEAYMLLHRLDIIVGDVNAKNVVLSAGSKPRVLVVDTDSARKKGTQGAFGGQPHTPHWEPPETLAAKRHHDHLVRSGNASAGELTKLSGDWKRQTKETDVYKFGLMVVRVLDYGRYRSQNRNPDKARRVLLANLGGTATRHLDRTLGADPRARPTMADWYYALRGRTVSHTASRESARAARTRHGAGATATVSGAGQGTASPATRAIGDWRFIEGTGWVRDDKAPKKRGAQ